MYVCQKKKCILPICKCGFCIVYLYVCRGIRTKSLKHVQIDNLAKRLYECVSKNSCCLFVFVSFDLFVCTGVRELILA
jgi:hypothetical protein